MYKQNGKRDSTYPLFSIRYNRRFVKLHIIASPMARHHYTKKIKKIPILLDSTSNDQPRKISTNARSSKRRRRKKNKDSFPSRRYQTTKRWSRALTVIIHVSKIDDKIVHHRYESAVYEAGRGGSCSVLVRPIHSDAVGHSVESGIPGVTHAAAVTPTETRPPLYL